MRWQIHGGGGKIKTKIYESQSQMAWMSEKNEREHFWEEHILGLKNGGRSTCHAHPTRGTVSKGCSVVTN